MGNPAQCGFNMPTKILGVITVLRGMLDRTSDGFDQRYRP